MFGKKYEKEIIIEGMHCNNCSKRIENVLKEVKEIKKVKIDLEEKKAKIISSKELESKLIKEMIENLGFQVIEIKEME